MTGAGVRGLGVRAILLTQVRSQQAFVYQADATARCSISIVTRLAQALIAVEASDKVAAVSLFVAVVNLEGALIRIAAVK